MPLYIAQRGDLGRCYRCLTDGQTLKDRATQLLIKYKSGTLVTQKKLQNITFGILRPRENVLSSFHNLGNHQFSRPLSFCPFLEFQAHF